MTIDRYNALARAVVLTISAMLLAMLLAFAVGAAFGLVGAIVKLRDQAAEQCELWEVGPDEGLSSTSR